MVSVCSFKILLARLVAQLQLRQYMCTAHGSHPVALVVPAEASGACRAAPPPVDRGGPWCGGRAELLSISYLLAECAVRTYIGTSVYLAVCLVARACHEQRNHHSIGLCDDCHTWTCHVCPPSCSGCLDKNP